MKINLIVANSEKGVIGKNNKIPWHNSKDLKRFKQITNNSYVIMGRKTFESIGKPLEGRSNLVLSTSVEEIPGARVFKDTQEVIFWLYNQEIAFPKMKIEAFVIGGSQVYKQFLDKDRINTIYQTIIKDDYDGDTFFDFKKENWESSIEGDTDTEKFIVWNKKKAKG